ncbi:MAG: amidohydrolase family protein, partial [Actinomycetia bacterium]|nr:amidohydrolase family protein [Actinomycetes bacterium]
GPLATVKHAVTRLTYSRRVMGETERIGVAEALEAMTLGGAYMLKRDDEIGSIEPGKLADMAVLADDPLNVDPEYISEIQVYGTVLGGQHLVSNVRELN